MNLNRRSLLVVAVASICAGCAIDRDVSSGPQVWRIERGNARVYIFGFGEAHDRSWLSPTVARALRESDELWFETPQANTSSEKTGLLILELGYDNKHPLFPGLDPALAERTLAAAASLNVTRERLANMRPWLARDTIQRAYQASGRAAAVPSEYADRVLAEQAMAEGKAIHSEFADFDALIRFFAGMNHAAQQEYLRDMLDYMDNAAKGVHARHEEWISGHPHTQSIDKMRNDTPELYKAMHVQRNAWWAAHIDQLLSRDGKYFVVVGLNHVLGPDSILQSLERRGIEAKIVK